MQGFGTVDLDWPRQSIPVMTVGHLMQKSEDMIGDDLHGTYVFRGQGDASWPLEPRLVREVKGTTFEANDIIAIESEMRQQFEAQAHLHLEPSVLEEGDFIAWWALMQHHGAPTRLLDWTRSPLVALYFAAVEVPTKDGAVWFFAKDRLREEMTRRFPSYFEQIMPNVEVLEEQCRTPDAGKAIYVVQRIRHTSRMIAQKGVFTMCTQVLGEHGHVIADALKDREGSHGVWIIERRDKQRLLAALQSANITASALFPGIDGIGRSMQDLVRNWLQGKAEPDTE